MKPLSKVSIIWSPTFAYCIGLLATDGNLSSDGRHINFTSKDFELAKLFLEYLNLKNKIGKKSSGVNKEKKYYVVQFGDVMFFRFLLSIGLTPCKSKTIGPLSVPSVYFYDFLRGCIDGDGSISAFKHPESKHLQLRVRLASASKIFLEWVQSTTKLNGINGYINRSGSIYSLIYAIADSTKLLHLLYYAGFPSSLERKYLRAKELIADVV